jgi:hypothetical protein
MSQAPDYQTLEVRQTPDVTISSPADLDRMIAASSRFAPWQIPLLRAVRAGRIALVQPTRTAAVSMRKLKTFGRPVLLVVGDDDHAPDAGPHGWSGIHRPLAWARAIVIHGAVGRPEEYNMAVALAEAVGRLVLVECSSCNAVAWNIAAGRYGPKALLHTIIPPAGYAHPAPIDKAVLQ